MPSPPYAVGGSSGGAHDRMTAAALRRSSQNNSVGSQIEAAIVRAKEALFNNRLKAAASGMMRSFQEVR